jgi:hypothetical protein
LKRVAAVYDRRKIQVVKTRSCLVHPASRLALTSGWLCRRIIPAMNLGKMPAMKRKILIPVFLAAFAVLAMLTGCFLESESKGRVGIFNAGYETVTNRLWALSPNAPSNFHPGGREIVAGQSYEFFLPEGEQDPASGTYTTILVTRIDPKYTRVQIKSTKLGPLYNTRDRQIEEQRLNELARLLSKKS